MHKSNRILVAVLIALSLLVAMVGSASAAPKHHAVPALSCTGTRHVFNSSYYTGGDGSIGVTVYMQWIEDPTTHGYCGSMQPFTKVDTIDCGLGQGPEPIQAEVSRLYTTSGSYLGGSGWNGYTTWGCSDGDWWAYGPIIPVACGTTVHAYAGWTEAALPNLEYDWGQPVAPDGEYIAGYSPAHTICVN